MSKKLSKEEQEEMLESFAHEVNKYLVDNDCVRKAERIKPLWASKEEICDAIGASLTMWKSIRDKILDLGYYLSIVPYGGYFIGFEGEQLSLLMHKKSIIRGVATSCQEDIVTLARNGKSLNDVTKRARTFGVVLGDIPKMLRALGAPLDPQIEIVLIEAKE